MVPIAIGKYQVTGFLGHGSMGEVYLAHDPLIGRPVAIKLMKSVSESDAERFRQEARTVGGLSHPNIVVLHDFGVHEGRAYLVMEYVGGTSLDAWLKQPRPLAEHLRVMEGLCAALTYAHAHGVLHRDLKPSNVHVLPDGQCKLMDFGIARTETVRLTTAGTVLGTPSYMAPEILEDALYSPQADFYALGVLFYEMLSGANPFAARTVTATFHNVLHVHPQHLSSLQPEVPAELADAIMALMEKNTRKRPRDASRLLGALRRLSLDASPFSASTRPLAAVAATQSLRGLPSLRTLRSRRLWRVGLAAAGLAAVVALVWTARRPGADAPTAPVSPAPVARPPAPGEPTAPATGAGAAPAARPAAHEPAPATGGPAARQPAAPARTGAAQAADLRSPPRRTGPPAESPAGAPQQPPPDAMPTPGEAPATPAGDRPAVVVATPPPEPEAPADVPAPVLAELRPQTVRRRTSVQFEVEGRGLRPGLTARVLRARHEASGLRVVDKQWAGPTRLRVTVLVEEDVPLGTYSLVVVDDEGRVSNGLAFEVVL